MQVIEEKKNGHTSTTHIQHLHPTPTVIAISVWAIWLGQDWCDSEWWKSRKWSKSDSGQICLNQTFNLETASIKTNHDPSGAPRKHTHKKNIYTRSKQQEVINDQVLLQFCSKHSSCKLHSTRSHNHHPLPSNHLRRHQLPNVLWSNCIHNLIIVYHTESQVI